jgi:nucleoside diphosphate kinase
MVKPDGVQRGLAGEIIKRFNNRGYKLVACKMLHVGDRDSFYSSASSHNFKRGVSGHKSQLIKKKSKSQFQGDQPVNRKKPFVYDC